jgi:predicted O-methyltransferase YrrM
MTFDFACWISYCGKMIAGLKRRLRRLARLALEEIFRLQGRTYYQQRFDEPHLAQSVLDTRGSDIRDHLNELFFMAVSARPKLMVELGTRGGESTRALLAAAALSNATLLSVDINDCAGLDLPYREYWRFIKADDIKFGMDGFKQWCAEEGVEPSIDVLFIDTSHEYEHTKNEIQVWSPYLGADGVMMFHDSNIRNGVYARTDGSFGYSPNRGRGVIQPIEKFLGRRYDENAYFADYANGFLVLHFPHCNGLTVLKKHSLADVKRPIAASRNVHVA